MACNDEALPTLGGMSGSRCNADGPCSAASARAQGPSHPCTPLMQAAARRWHMAGVAGKGYKSTSRHARRLSPLPMILLSSV